MKNNEYIYNGVGIFKLNSVKKVFIENGSNLEKKYNVKYLGIEKYKKADYIIFKFDNGHILVKDFDNTYFEHIKYLFNVN